MLRLFVKIEPTPPINSPFRITQVSQFEGDAQVWWQNAAGTRCNDVLIVDFPECKCQDAQEFVAWVHHRPKLIDVMEALHEDRIAWSLWSVDHEKTTLKTPINDQDLKFLKSLRVSWDEEKPASDQSGLHLV